MYQKTILKNGLRLITYSMPESEAVTAQIFFGTGSHYEDESINGISHFLEHLFFKGSKKYPKPGQLHEEVDKVGGIHNAFTGEEVTSYYIKVSHQYIDLALELLADSLLNPLFPNGEIEKERTVILEEMKLFNDDPDSKVAIKFEELLYGDQPAGRPIVGQESVIRSLQQKDFFDYKQAHYHINNAVVVMTGRIEGKEIAKKVEKLFARLPKGKAKKKEKVKPPSGGPKVIVEQRSTSEQSKIILGVPSYSLFDRRRWALGVLANIIGGTTSSRLFKKIREERGLAYSVYSFASQAIDSGFFISFAGTELKNAETVTTLMRDEYAAISQRGVSVNELKMAQDNIVGRLGIGLETSDRWAGFLGSQEILERRIMMPEHIADKVKRVTREEIQRVAKDIFKTKNLHLAVLGPFPENAQLRFQELLKS